MLINEETIEYVNRLVQMGFTLNRLWDRGISVLNVDFAMNKFASIFHEGLAHRYPIEWSDFFSHILDKYNIKTKYYETQEDISEYKNPKEFFEKNLEYHKQAYDLLKEAINVATINGDLNVEKELNKFMPILNNYMEQAILLVDKSNVLKNDDWFMFDHMCDSFFLFKD